PKTLEICRIATQSKRQYLQSDMATEGFLNRFINDAHAAPADLPNNVIIAELFQGPPIGGDAGARGVEGLRLLGARLFYHYQSRKNLVDFLGQLGMTLCVFTDGRPFAAPIALDKLLRQLINRVSLGLAHGCLSLGPFSPSYLRTGRLTIVRGSSFL